MFKNLFAKKETEKPRDTAMAEVEKLRDPAKTDFCYYPFFQVLLSAEGKYMPCSKHACFITNEGKELTADNASLEDAWNSDYMSTLRDNFHKNIRSAGCSQCWKEQGMGLKPMRYDSYDYQVPESQVIRHESPMRVEINASNVCNLRCRICWSHASNRWIKEAKLLYGHDSEVHLNMTPENQATVRKWVPHFSQIGFFGGEPLMAKENIDLMQYCIDTGHSKHISLLINTNTTVYSDEIVNILKQFKNVYLNMSIDDIGERFEYERSGAKWNEVFENMKSFIKHGGYTGDDQMEIKICCSVTSMNIYYFPEYFEFLNEHFPGLPVYLNLVYYPHELSIQLLPREIKEQIAQRLRAFVKTSFKMEERRTKTVENLITWLNEHDDRDFGEFFSKIELHDRFRQESFAKTFPEFYDMIEKYKPVMV